MPAWAEAQLPASIASNTPRQSLGMTTFVVGRGGGDGWFEGDRLEEGGACVVTNTGA